MQRGPAGWVSISSQEFYRNVAGTARGLQEWGISAGDRGAILAENRPEWTIADFAGLLLGAVIVPIYPTLTSEQTAYVLNDCGARVAFVSTEAQLQKIVSIQNQTAVGHIVVMGAATTARAFPMDRLMHGGPQECDPQLDARARTVRPADLATIIY